MNSYQAIRAAGRTMHSKALDASRHLDFNPIRIAKRMTLPVTGRTLVFEGEVSENAFCDFWTHEYRVDGKTLVEHIDPAAEGLNALETEFLQATRQARTSFFQVDEVAPAEPRLRLRDLLEPDRPDVWLTDLGLSDSIRRLRVKLALFCRLITVSEFTMTSGFSFSFRPKDVPGFSKPVGKKRRTCRPKRSPRSTSFSSFRGSGNWASSRPISLLCERRAQGLSTHPPHRQNLFLPHRDFVLCLDRGDGRNHPQRRSPALSGATSL